LLNEKIQYRTFQQRLPFVRLKLRDNLFAQLLALFLLLLVVGDPRVLKDLRSGDPIVLVFREHLGDQIF
jgi:hypothetical protein